MHQELFNLLEYTSRSVFLTGKAGTGKTTFLNEFVKRTSKNYIVVAPTGIAAINAGGVTIHSMFGLPLSTFVPTTDDIDRNEAINMVQLLPHFKYRHDKLKLLRSLEILIVDEVSMLRADVLDMMDLSLRAARRSTQKFGGVQLLLIGDLYQLPPVVKQSSEAILFKYYPTPFFFSAKALEQSPLLTVELTKVYRQKDGHFLQILNCIRENDLSGLDFDLLHSRYLPMFEPEEGYVYLVSHNYMADAINQKKLEELDGRLHRLEAVVTGDFKESLYPNDSRLSLKKGAQVMFIRNDTSDEKNYFNGMLAKVTSLADDEIKVLPNGKTNELTVSRERWENKKYYTDDDKKIQEDVIGSYEQFPFRLAWAVTIHKSQGLTFDKVVIDAGRSFTSGQVYVALSRCRTLEGLVLKSRITPSIIYTDERIKDFQNATNAGNAFAQIIENEKYGYALGRLVDAIGLSGLNADFLEWKEQSASARSLKQHEVEAVVATLNVHLSQLNDVLEKFLKFIADKTRKHQTILQEWPLIEAKSVGAVNYFFQNVHQKIFEPLKEIYATTKGVKGLKKYNSTTKALLDGIESYLYGLKKADLLGKKLYVKKEGDAVSAKVSQKPTHVKTFELFEEGKTLAEIAELRELTIGTIFGHLSKFAALGLLNIDRLFSSEQLHTFKNAFTQQRFDTLTAWKVFLGDAFEFHELRLLLNHFEYLSKKNPH